MLRGVGVVITWTFRDLKKCPQQQGHLEIEKICPQQQEHLEIEKNMPTAGSFFLYVIMSLYLTVLFLFRLMHCLAGSSIYCLQFPFLMDNSNFLF